MVEFYNIHNKVNVLCHSDNVTGSSDKASCISPLPEPALCFTASRPVGSTYSPTHVATPSALIATYSPT